MNGHEVLALLDLLKQHGVHVWIDGGWAVDACLGTQTRAHSDLDIVVEQHDAAVINDALTAAGYGPVPRDDTRAWNYVLGDAAGHEVDFHVVVLDAGGNGIYGPPENNDLYPAQALSGSGTINGRPVSCTTPQWLVASHTGYEIRDKDRADVLALCERFRIPLPAEFRTAR
jgi:lincosamide nucleotidyltransferase A/C/D/E